MAAGWVEELIVETATVAGIVETAAVTGMLAGMLAVGE